MARVVRVEPTNHDLGVIDSSLQLLRIALCSLSSDSQFARPHLSALLQVRDKLIFFKHANQGVLALVAKDATITIFLVQGVLSFDSLLGFFEIVAVGLQTLLKLLCMRQDLSDVLWPHAKHLLQDRLQPVLEEVEDLVLCFLVVVEILRQREPEVGLHHFWA